PPRPRTARRLTTARRPCRRPRPGPRPPRGTRLCRTRYAAVISHGSQRPQEQADMRKLFVLFAATAALATAACNTVAGVGQDAQAAGEAVENCAEGRSC